MEIPEANFEKNVFINCPFDVGYKPLLRAMLFALVYCGMKPRIAAERSDSGEVRVSKILSLIKDCQFSIHDISRAAPLIEGDLPRFNMPFELGIEIGYKAASPGAFLARRCLIFDSERYRYQKTLSDLAGSDIKSHGGEPEKLVRQLRNWLVENVRPDLPSGTEVWEALNEFYTAFEQETKNLGFKEPDIADMPVLEFVRFIYLLRKPAVS
jgi:hypothetical protein